MSTIRYSLTPEPSRLENNWGIYTLLLTTHPPASPTRRATPEDCPWCSCHATWPRLPASSTASWPASLRARAIPLSATGARSSTAPATSTRSATPSPLSRSTPRRAPPRQPRVPEGPQGARQPGAAAYFGERAFKFKSSEFAGRYWGVDSHNRLLETKQAYDPKGVFGCRNCVGSEGANAGASTFDVCVCECVVLFLVQLLICAFSRFRCFEGSLKHHVAQPFPVLGEPSVPALSFLNTA